MRQGFFSQHWMDQHDKPSGGVVSGRGLVISWQNGPLGRGAERVEPNGAFVEDVIAAALERMEWYQRTGFSCDENATAISHLVMALSALNQRTARREAANIEGTHAEEADIEDASDACDCAPELDLADCCRAHGRAYELQQVTRAEADRELRRCIAAQRPLLAWCYWIVVRVGGWIAWRRSRP